MDDMNITLPRMVSLAQAAELTGLSYGCLRQLCIDGKIVFFRSGARRSKYMINLDKLFEFLNTGDN